MYMSEWFEWNLVGGTVSRTDGVVGGGWSLRFAK